jgi:hypothetical protein
MAGIFNREYFDIAIRVVKFPVRYLISNICDRLQLREEKIKF